MKNSVVIYLSVLLMCFNFNISKAQGGMLKEVSLERQIEASDLVVEGRVVGAKSIWNSAKDNIYTLYTIEIYKVFKGVPLEFIDVVVTGGRVGDVEQVLLPNLHLEVNAVGIFTLFEQEDLGKILSNNALGHKKYVVYSSLQGFYAHNAQQNSYGNVYLKSGLPLQSFYDKIEALTQREMVSIGQLNVLKTKPQGVAKRAALIPEAITFSPTTVTAGNSTLLTINGSGFGTIRGAVDFRNADTGGRIVSGEAPIYREALSRQIVSWTDSQIRVIVPFWAGTGDIRVRNSDGTQGVSVSSLTVDAAIINDSEGRRAQHVSLNNTGNITWQFNTQFDANTLAKTSFLRALDTWRCETRIHWEMDASTSPVSRSASDGVNIITFDTASNPLPEGVLGVTNYFIVFCGGERGAVTEIDIVFNDNLNDPSTVPVESWYFGENPNGINFVQWDFQSVALHELGHAHQLGHVIDTDDVMHFAISNFEIQRGLNLHNIEAAQNIQNVGTTAFVCGFSRMTDYNGACVLNTNISELEREEVSVYPNPAQSQFYINTTSAVSNLDYAELYDISGRRVKTVALTSNKQLVDVAELQSGVYFVSVVLKTQVSKSMRLVID